MIVSVDDDPERFFQSSPPAPIDMAVMFSNLRRLGVKKVASAAALAWEKPDPIGLAALEKSLEKFDSLVLTAPLSRGVVPTPMPAAFRRTSLPLSSIHGDATQLPLVNRLPIPEIILGGDETIAGFSFLESELDNGDIPLMARWDERVVFAFPLVTLLQRLDLPLAGVEIRLGEYMKLGPAGPLVPVDKFGRLAMKPKTVSPFLVISADALIDGRDDLFPKQAPDPVILRDDMSAADTRTRAFSQELAGVIAGIASNGGLSDAHEFHRLSENGEAGIVAVVVVALALLGGMSMFVRNIGALVLVGVAVAAQWIAFGAGSLWLPGVAVLATVLVTTALGLLLKDKAPPVKTLEPAVLDLRPPTATAPTPEPQQVQAAATRSVPTTELEIIAPPKVETVISPEPVVRIATPPLISPRLEPVPGPPPSEQAESEPWWAMYADGSTPPPASTSIPEKPPLSEEPSAGETVRLRKDSLRSESQKGRKRR